MNKAILIGRLTKDLELKKTPSGASVINFSLAVNRIYQSKNPNDPTVDFISCQAWGKTADVMTQYLAKGSQVAIEGRIQVRNYENQQQQKIYVTEVVVERVEFLDSRSSGNQYDHPAPTTRSQQKPQNYDYPVAEDEEPDLDISTDELPF